MPIPIEEFANPEFIRFRQGYTISRLPNARAKYSEIVWREENETRRYRNGQWPRAGYNPNRQATRVERVRITNDNPTLNPY